jgi:hypothetical protein
VVAVGASTSALQLFCSKIVDEYFGYSINAILGIRCASGPSTFCRIVPTFITVGLSVQTLALAVFGFEHWELRYVHDRTVGLRGLG